jgi:hypothetical protein
MHCLLVCRQGVLSKARCVQRMAIYVIEGAVCARDEAQRGLCCTLRS